MNCKKRKPDTDGLALEAERSLHQSFVHAANAVSQLYTHALTHQHKRAHVDGARQVLERQVNWVVREYGNSASIPTSVLLSFLRQELQGVHLAETQCSAPAAAPAFGHAEHPLAERHFIHAVARRPGQDSMDGFVPGPYLPGPGFGSTHFPTGGSR